MFPIISLGPLSLPAPPLILLIGIWLGSALAEKKITSRGRVPANFDRILWTGVAAGLIGARISFFARNPGAFQGQFLAIFSLNPALLDLSGGILIALAASYYQITRHQLRFLDVLDDFTPFFAVFAPALFLSHYAAGAGFGMLTALPWGVEIWGGSRHPVQLYYAAGSLAVLALTQITGSVPEADHPGSAFALFFCLTFGYLCFFSAYQDPAGLEVFGFRTYQVVYWVLFTAGLFYLAATRPGGKSNEIEG